MQIELIAARDLSGDYGRVYSGDRFSVSEETAQSLIERQLAYRAYVMPVEQKMQPVAVENKMLVTEPENKIQQQPARRNRR